MKIKPFAPKTLIVLASMSILLSGCVEVDDGQGNNLQVDSPLQPDNPGVPIADAGLYQAVSGGDVVTLDGSASSDPDNDSLTYLWTQTGGSPVVLSDLTAVSPTFVAPSGLNADTVLEFELTVSDGEFTSIADVVNVTVQMESSSQLNWTADFEVDSGEFTWGALPRVTGDAQSGDYFIRYVKEINVNNSLYADYFFGDHIYAAEPTSAPVDELYLRFYYRVSPGYDVDGSNRQKVVLVNSDAGNPFSRRYQVFLMLNPGGELQLEHSYIDSWRFFGLPQNRNGQTVTVNYGSWDKIKIYIKQNTPGQANGIVRMWINDVLKTEYLNLNLRESTSYGMNKLIMSTYQPENSVATASGFIDFDNFRISDRDILD